jgi:AcrR family transcriptional regulator
MSHSMDSAALTAERELAACSGSDLPLDLRVATGIQLVVAEAALRCIARFGVSKTTLDDIAREAGCSRATLYRAFPGGRDSLAETVVETEIARFFGALAERLESIDDLETLLVATMDEAVQRIGRHPALQFLIVHEPEIVLPRVAFSAFDTVLALASAFLAPYLSEWLREEDARRVGEWVARIVMSYLLCPPVAAGSRDRSHLPDEAYLRHLVRSFVLPGIRELQSPTSRSTTPS